MKGSNVGVSIHLYSFLLFLTHLTSSLSHFDVHSSITCLGTWYGTPPVSSITLLHARHTFAEQNIITSLSPLLSPSPLSLSPLSPPLPSPLPLLFIPGSQRPSFGMRIVELTQFVQNTLPQWRQCDMNFITPKAVSHL